MPLIAQTELVEAFHHVGTSDYTLVTFGELSMRANGQRFWGQQIVQALNINCVSFVARFPHWYPKADFSPLLEIAKPLLRGKEVIVYGTSMGGYGALKYGDTLGATHVVAVAPQFSINPKDVPWDRRYLEHYKLDLHENMGIEPIAATDNINYWLLYDPWYSEDRAHARLIEAAIPCRHIPVHATGHITIKAISGTEVFKAIINFVRAYDDVSLYRTLRKAKKGSPVYFLELLGFVARRGNEKAAETLAEMACERGARRSDARGHLAAHMLIARRPEAAERFALQALEADAKHRSAHHVLITALEHQNRAEEAAAARQTFEAIMAEV